MALPVHSRMQITDCYQPYYCEENIWRLAQSGLIDADDASVCIVSNRWKSCAFRHQRAASHPDDILIWDYHVVLIETSGKKVRIWDLDSRLGCPVPADSYLARTFSGRELWPQRYRPVFRLIEAREYVDKLSTDRSHMKDADGHYVQPPPQWKAPFDPAKGNNLPKLIDMTRPFIGERLTWDELRAKFGLNPR